jgi:hypothetical protein
VLLWESKALEASLFVTGAVYTPVFYFRLLFSFLERFLGMFDLWVNSLFSGYIYLSFALSSEPKGVSTFSRLLFSEKNFCLTALDLWVEPEMFLLMSPHVFEIFPL